MDLESKNIDLLERLRKLRERHCCQHINNQIELWTTHHLTNDRHHIINHDHNPAHHQHHHNHHTNNINTTSNNTNHNHHQQEPILESVTIKTESQEQLDQDQQQPLPDQQRQLTLPSSSPPTPPQQQQQQLIPPPPQKSSPPKPRVVDKNSTDERTIGCFLSNIKHLENLDSDATESTSSDDNYDELEGFSHEDIPPRTSNFLSTRNRQQHPYHHATTAHHPHQQQLQQPQQQQIQQPHHRASTSSLYFNQNQSSLHQRRASHQYNISSSYNEASTSSYSNNIIAHNSHISDLKKKAIWKWANERSRLASKWTWLQAQIADLEFRVRGQNDALMQTRAYKTSPLPRNLPESSCSRTVPLSKDFRRRRLIKSSQILSNSNKKSVKFSHVPCVCSSLPQTVAPCLSCNGRYNYLKQLDGENAPLLERVSLLDPGCHPVLSFPDDVTLGSQLTYLLKQETINRKPTKGKPGRKKGSTNAKLAAAAASAQLNGDKDSKLAGKKGKWPGMVGRPSGAQQGLKIASQTMIASHKLRRKYRKHSNNPNAHDSNNWFSSNHSNNSSTKRNKRIRSASSMNESSLCSESSNPYHPSHFTSNQTTARNVTRRRRSEQSAYDIDNIVIPFSVAATTRVEILEYKEIITPSWRVMENGVGQTENNVDDQECEDTSDEAYIQRHTKGECEERKRFSLKPPPKNNNLESNANATSTTTSSVTNVNTTTTATTTITPTTTTITSDSALSPASDHQNQDQKSTAGTD